MLIFYKLRSHYISQHTSVTMLRNHHGMKAVNAMLSCVEQCWAMLSNIELGSARLGYYYYGTTNKNNNKAWCNFLHNNQGQSQIKRTSHIGNIPQTLTVNNWKHPNSYPKLTHGWRLTALDLDLLDLIILLYKWHLDVSERAN